jgi:hypothetical protein
MAMPKMSDDTKSHNFSEHHQRHVRTTFQYIDKLLSEAEHTMADAGSPSPFRRHSDDTTPIQRKVTHDYIVRIREAMRRVMEELEIPPPEPHSGAVWAATINMMYCSISLNELTPERMRAYGPLSPEAADSCPNLRRNRKIRAIRNTFRAYSLNCRPIAWPKASLSLIRQGWARLLSLAPRKRSRICRAVILGSF